MRQACSAKTQGVLRAHYVGKCLDTAVTAVRSITSYYSYVMSKEEGFYVQETHSYINVLGRIGTSACSVEVVPTH